tara:strand:- start:532 stop:864 length:333 start_codon:yes stop_codon:yes gene_type:complete
MQTQYAFSRTTRNSSVANDTVTFTPSSNSFDNGISCGQTGQQTGDRLEISATGSNFINIQGYDGSLVRAVGRPFLIKGIGNGSAGYRFVNDSTASTRYDHMCITTTSEET